MERKKGRPIGSAIRQNLIEILHHKKRAYGYELYKAYCDIFPEATLRVIYYHLKKGVVLEEFEVQEIKSEKGNYSWGDTSEKIYYTLGRQAKPAGDKRVDEYFEKKKELS